MSTTETLEAKSQEDCALKNVRACTKDCQPNCPHYFSINAPISEQEIVRKYNNFKRDPDYKD